MHPDQEGIKKTFVRDKKYYIRVNDDFVHNEDINKFYNQLQLGSELHRLDYLLMNIIGMKRAYIDDKNLYSGLGKIEDILREKGILCDNIIEKFLLIIISKRKKVLIMEENQLQKEIDKMSKSIKTDNYPMSIGELSNLYLDGDININPIYQRMFRWDITQQSALIESILLQIPIPPIYVFQDEDGTWSIIDGQQRLSTIFKFMGILKQDNECEDEEIKEEINQREPLTKTRFLPSLEGKYWDDENEENSLTEAQRRYIKRSKILIVIIDKSSDEFAQYEMFQRLNTGGSHLSAQEIRNCILVMRNESVYKQIKKLSEYDNFRKAIPISEKDMEEQGYIELVVKYMVLRYSEWNVNDSENFNNFLTDEILKMIINNQIDFEMEGELFKKVFDLIFDVMEDNAFKKFDPIKGKNTGAVLVGAYEAIIPGLAINYDYFRENRNELKNKICSMYTDERYIAATKRGVRPVGRIKKLAAFSRENFNSGK